MDDYLPPQPRHEPRSGPGSRHQHRPAKRIRRFIIGACAAAGAAALAVTLVAGLRGVPQADTSATGLIGTGFSASGLSGTGLSASGLSGTGLSAAGEASDGLAGQEEPADAASTDPELAAAINGIIDANGQYQIGVALLELSDGAVQGGTVQGSTVQDGTGQDGTGQEGAVQEYGVEAEFMAASTAKVLAAAAYLNLVETGEASLDDRLGNYRAEIQLQAMIQESNNDSWSLIMDAVGHDELSAYAAAIGVDYHPETNTLTPAAMARILAGLYSGGLLDPEHTAQLLSYMQDTNYESLIPAAVPSGVEVFHKYGLLGGNLHDAAILTGGGAAYALVVYTKGADLSDIPERTAVFHDVARAVVDGLF